MLKSFSKLKAIWSVFATQEITFNRKKVLNLLDTSNVTKTRVAITEKPKTPAKQNKKGENQNNNWDCNNFK